MYDSTMSRLCVGGGMNLGVDGQRGTLFVDQLRCFLRLKPKVGVVEDAAGITSPQYPKLLNMLKVVKRMAMAFALKKR